MLDPVSSRALGQFPLSIATSLAIESAVGIHPEIEVREPPIKNYDELWVNLRTLFRNFMGSLEGNGQKVIPVESMAHALQMEMETITQVIREVAPVKVVFYISNYNGMAQKYRHATVRMDNTPKQKDFTFFLNKTIDYLLKQYGKDGPIKVFERKLKSDGRAKVMIVTHYAYDLLSASAFKELVLLESHTGKIKPKALWHTKYLNGKDLSQIPFMEIFLQVFGDNETFRPMDIKLRQAVLEIADKYKWSSVSTNDKIVYGINQIKNPYFKEVLRSML